MKAIVVLGSEIVRDSLTGNYNLTQMLKMRLDQCYEVFIQNYDDQTIVVVSGGSPHGESASEAELMKMYLINKGIPSCKIFEENKSNNTIENCQYTYNLLKTLYRMRITFQELNPNYKYNDNNRQGEIPPFKEVYIITSDFHVPRSMVIFERYNFNNLILNFVAAPTPKNISQRYLDNEKYLIAQS